MLEDDSLRKLLNPTSIAVIGASESEGSVGHAILENLATEGFRGRIFPVNPKFSGRRTMACVGTQCPRYLASAEELPENEVDLALIMTPRQTVVPVLDTLGSKKVPAAVVITAGFKEIGEEGMPLTEELRQIVEHHKMLLVGPNCLGIANMSPSIRMNATFAQHAPLWGKGAVLSQSGAIGIDIIQHALQLGLGLSQFVSLGNELQVGPRELIRHWQHDPTVAYIMGYMEAGSSLAKMREVARETTKQKPILMIKAGRSSAGVRAARSHTGALAGSDRAVNALMVQTGIHRFHRVRDLFAAAQAFENAKPSIGNRVAVFSNAGGYAVMASDLLDPRSPENRGLVLATFNDKTAQRLEQLLPKTSSRLNPVDTTATAPIDDFNNYQEALLAVLQDPGVDACLVPLVSIRGIHLEEMGKMIARLQESVNKPVVTMVLAGDDALRQMQQAVKEEGLAQIALYTSIEDAITGLAALEQQRVWSQKPIEQKVSWSDVRRDAVRLRIKQVQEEGRTMLTTAESLEVLQAYGIPTPRFHLAQTTDEALEKAAAIGYPVAIKLNSKTVSHKTDVGGVMLDIRTQEELEKSFQTMLDNLRRLNLSSFEAGEGIMIQEFLTRGREVILGASEDPDFGKVIVLGRGGIYAQIDQDIQFRLNPVTRQDVQEMIRGIRAYPILKGTRGKPGVDLEGLENIVLRLSQLVSDFPEIVELDINPFMALPRKEEIWKGGMAVDSRIILQ